MAGFKIATGYVEVEVIYDRNNLRKAASAAGKDAGSSFMKSFFDKKNFDKIATKAMQDSGDSASKSFSESFSKGMERGQKDSLKFVPKFAKSFADEFNNSLPKHLRSGSKQFEKTFRDSYHKGMPSLGREAAKAYVKAVNKQISREDIRYTNINAVRRLAITAGDNFVGNYSDRLKKRMPREVNRAFTMGSGGTDQFGRFGRSAANSFINNLSTRLKESAKSSTSHMREAGASAGNAFVRGVRSSTTGSKGIFGPIVEQARRNKAALESEGSNGGRLFTRAMGGALQTGGHGMMTGFRQTMSKNIHLTLGGLITILAGVAVAMPAIGTAIAGALHLGFVGGIAALGVAAWKESENVKKAFRSMTDFVVSDFKRVSAPMESVLVDLANDIRGTYTALSPALEEFFLTTEPAFKSFQKNILDGFAEWGPAIEGSGTAFAALEKSMGPMMQEKIAELGAAFERMFAAIEKNPEAVTAVFRGIMNAIIFVIDALTWLTETWAKMREAWMTDAGGMRTIIQSIGSVLEGVIGTVVAVGQGMLTALWEMVSGIVSGIQMIFSGDILAGIARIFEGIFRGLGTMISGMVEGIAHLVAKFFQIFGVDTSTWVTNTMNFLHTAWNGVLNFFQSLPGIITGWFSSMWDGIKNTFNSFVSWITNFGATLISWVTFPFREIYRIIVGNSIIPDLVNAVLSWIQNMLTWIMVPLNGIKNFFITVFTAIWNTVTTLVRTIVNTVVTIFRGLGSGVQSVLSGLGNFFSTVWNRILNLTRSIWNAITNTIRTVFSAVVNWVRTTLGGWASWIQERFSSLRNNVRNIWNAMTAAIRSVVSAVVNWVRNTFSTWVSWIQERFSSLRNNVRNIWNSMTTAIRNVVSAVVNWVRSTFNSWVGWIYDKFNAMRNNVRNIWNSMTTAIRNVVTTVVNWVRNTFNSWVGWIYDKFNAMRNNVRNIWNQLRMRIYQVIRDLVLWVRNTFTSWVGWIYDKFNALRTNASNIWNQLRDRIQDIVRGVVNWVRNTFTSWVGWIYDKFNDLRRNALNIWERLREGIIDKVTDFRDKAMDVVNKFKDGVIEAFERAKDGVERAWNKVKDAAAAPVKFMVNTVYEQGIRILWSKIADHTGLPYLKKINLPQGFATGGIMPGYTPGRDVHAVPGPNGPVGLSGGEAIMRPEWTRAIGAQNVHRMNAAARSGGVTGVRRALGISEGYASGGVAGNTGPNGYFKGRKKRGQFVEKTPFLKPGEHPRVAQNQGYALGGIIDTVKSKVKGAWDSIVGNIVGWAKAPLNSLVNTLKGGESGGSDKKNTFKGVPYRMGIKFKDAIIDVFQGQDDAYNAAGGGNWSGATGNLKAAVDWARTQNGLPYQWGGNGNPSWDCSGYLSAIESVIRGQRPHRRWSTHAFGTRGPSGWERNLDSPFMVGITHAGVGHTAGTIMGNKVEAAGGGKGVRFNNGALGHDNKMFTAQYGFHNAIKMAKQESEGGGGSGSGRWAGLVRDVLRELGMSQSHAANVLKAIQKESGGNPRAINNWDSNAAAGTPSKGLLQTIDPTFNAYAGKYKNLGPYNPKANIYAAIRYASARYGSGWSARMAAPGGYSLGGIIGGSPLGSGSHDVGGLLPDRGIAHNRSGEAEVVQTLDQLKALAKIAEGGGDTIVIEKICIDAKNVKDFNDVVEVVKGVRKAGRSNGGNVRFRRDD